MNYIELINNFWALNKEYSFTPNEKAVYFALLNKCNELGWKNPFNQSNGYLAMDSGMSESAMQKARNTLQQKQLLSFAAGDGRRINTQYMLLSPQKGKFKTDLSGTLSNTLSNTLSDTLSDEKGTDNNKQVNKTKLKEGIGPEAGQRKRERKIFIKPILKDVQDYFLETIGNAKNQKSWPREKCLEEAAKFFDHYSANGWVQNKGKPIVDWRASVRLWIRNELSGAFKSKAQLSEEKINSYETTPKQKQLSKIEVDINGLYERFLENEIFVTSISTDAAQYNHLKNAGLINFEPKQNESIHNEAVKVLNGHCDESKLLSMKKKIGVIEFFKQHKQAGHETIFRME